MEKFAKYCTPAKIYFVLSVIGCLIALFHNVKIVAVLVKFLFVLFWTFVLNWLCKKGFKAVSWFLVLLPFIMIILGALGLMRYSKTHMIIN